MSTLVLEHDPCAASVLFSKDKFVIELTDGRSMTMPLSWYPRLLHGTPTERDNWQMLGDGYAMEWPDLDEDIGMEGLIASRRCGESEKSF